MSQSAVKIVKSVDLARAAHVTISVIDEREFWVSMRQVLLQQLALIEKRLGISRRCRNCGEDVSSR